MKPRNTSRHFIKMQDLLLEWSDLEWKNHLI